MEQTSGNEATGDFLEFQPSAMTDGMKIIEALSNEDAVNIFFYVKDVIESSTDAIRALGLSQKRYYTRLKVLLEAGLIEKTEKGYEHTFMGKLIYKLGLSLLKIVENKEQLSVLNTITKSGDLSTEETKKIADVLSIEFPFSDINTEDVKIISIYDDLIKITTNMIDNSSESIFIANKYIEMKIIDISLKKIERGVKARVILEKMDKFIAGIKVLFSILSDPMKKKSFLNFFNSENLEIRFFELPYTFYIIDGKQSLIEIKNPITDEFQFAFYIKNEDYSNRLTNLFESLWDKSSKLKENFKLY